MLITILFIFLGIFLFALAFFLKQKTQFFLGLIPQELHEITEKFLSKFGLLFGVLGIVSIILGFVGNKIIDIVFLFVLLVLSAVLTIGYSQFMGRKKY
jgi:hypothetical protein